jgi:hypothetical protein
MEITSQDRSMVEHARKWTQLGIETLALRVAGQHGSKKLIGGIMNLNPEILADPNGIPDGFNFLGIKLRNSGLLCLDVEGLPGSVEDFNELLGETGVSADSLLVERSLNGGLHVYFQMPQVSVRTEHFKSHGRIRYDILTDRRVFTAPSFLRGKSYSWIGEKFFELESRSQIPDFPEGLLKLLDI